MQFTSLTSADLQSLLENAQRLFKDSTHPIMKEIYNDKIQEYSNELRKRKNEEIERLNKMVLED